jgi:hypothetical protein
MSSITFGVKCGQSPHERSRLCRYHSSRRDSHHSSEHSDCVAPGRQGCRRGRTHVQLMKVSWSSIVVKTLSACRCVAISDNVVVSTPAILMLAACRRSQPDGVHAPHSLRAPRRRRRRAARAGRRVRPGAECPSAHSTVHAARRAAARARPRSQARASVVTYVTTTYVTRVSECA